MRCLHVLKFSFLWIGINKLISGEAFSEFSRSHLSINRRISTPIVRHADIGCMNRVSSCRQRKVHWNGQAIISRSSSSRIYGTNDNHYDDYDDDLHDSDQSETESRHTIVNGRGISFSTKVLENVTTRLTNNRNDEKHASVENDTGVDRLEKMTTFEERADRRMFMASALMAAGVALGGSPQQVEARQLQWEASPVNKRYGVTVFDAEKTGYTVQFITYLSRFLLSFDEECQRWWYARAKDIPRMATSDEVEAIRLKQFGALSASVEIGLQEYQLPDGPKRLMASLLQRYCPSPESLKKTREAQGLPPLSQNAEDRQQMEIKEARRQIALLFGLMKINQPVEDITTLLAGIDNGSIKTIEVQNPGSGYAPGYGSPLVTFSPPEAGKDYEKATGIAILRPNGKILRIDIKAAGSGYTKPPTVTISPPLASKNDIDPQATAAKAKAAIFRDGSHKGKLMRIDLIEPGSGYAPDERIKIEFSDPDTPFEKGGRIPLANAVMELEVGEIKVTGGGSGYAVEKPIEVFVEPPPLTARVDLNNKLMASIIAPDQPFPLTTIPSSGQQSVSKISLSDDSTSLSAKILRASKLGGGGGGGCIGRACYDKPVVATAYAVAEKDSYASFRTDDKYPNDQEFASMPVPKNESSTRKVSGSGDVKENRPALSFMTSTVSSSSQLLQLLPTGIGLEYDEKQKLYTLAVDTASNIDTGKFKNPSVLKPIDPEFGPRGRSPIERNKVLDLNTFGRFIASGALCSSSVHLLLTPLDVIKTKVQTDNEKYPNVVAAFQSMAKEEDKSSFFSGWAPTFAGFFFLGGISFSTVEFLRRYFTELAGTSASSLEIPIILGSASISAFLGSFVLSPFEAVRVRSVAQPDYAGSALGVLGRMVEVSILSFLIQLFFFFKETRQFSLIN